MPMHNDRNRALALALTDRVGWKLIHRLLDRFGTLDGILSASPDDLQTVHGIGKQIAAKITGIDLDRVARDMQRFESQEITVAIWQDDTYPERLMCLEDRPLALFWKGRLPDPQSIAIVGTREPQAESVQRAYQLAAGLASRGWTVVSGMARGIDTAAHQGALSANGQTVAVLGCGVNVIYPPENRTLAKQIIAHGGLISEVHPNTSPSTTALMRRNRLIAAFSRALVVMEAGETSGALHAARYAHECVIPVFAVDNSAGNAALLRDFAQLLPDSADALINQIKQG